MSNGKVNVLGVNIDRITMQRAVERLLALLEHKNRIVVCTPNPEHIICAQKDKELMNIINTADFALPDGIGVVIASRIIGQPLPERVPGFDFIHELFEHDLTFYLFGGKPGVADAAAVKLRKKFPGIKIVGTNDGYFANSAPIIGDINRVAPDVLLVCLGAPKQEKWIHTNKNNLNVGVLIGAGGTLDGIAGNVKRAPPFMRKLGLEWLYRIIKQPSRIPRVAAFPWFLIRVFCSRFKKIR